jgi:hypothetical protein
MEKDHPVALRQHLAMMYCPASILDAVRSSRSLRCHPGRPAHGGQQTPRGKNVTSAFQDIGIFPPLVRMLRVGDDRKPDAALLNVSYLQPRSSESIARCRS